MRSVTTALQLFSVTFAITGTPGEDFRLVVGGGNRNVPTDMHSVSVSTEKNRVVINQRERKPMLCV